jgi:hypothetical protein
MTKSMETLKVNLASARNAQIEVEKATEEIKRTVSIRRHFEILCGSPSLIF